MSELQRHGARFAVRIIDTAHTCSVDLDALLDSGATTTAIDADIARAMGLLTDRHAQLTGAFVGARTAIVLRPFVLLFLGSSAVRVEFDGALALDDMERLAGCSVLLGRDVLAHCSMTYDGRTERVRLTFAA